MGDLLIRVDLREKVLRSVGDAPHGIVCMVAPDDTASWAIDAGYQPPQVDAIPGGGVVFHSKASDSGCGPSSTLVDTDDMVAGCESPLEARGLLEMAAASVFQIAQMAVPALKFELLASHVALAQETRDALERHGYLTRQA
jgi:hypothetical protein